MIVEVGENELPAAAAIHAASWKASHRAFCKADFIERHTPETQALYLRQEMERGKKVYMLIEERPVGIVSIIDSLIENLYVLPDEQRRGYGAKLLQFALQKCADTPMLWILDNNARAYRLYTKYGFVKTGVFHRLSPEIAEIEMKRRGEEDAGSTVL